jgi:hypothetical protein
MRATLVLDSFVSSLFGSHFREVDLKRRVAFAVALRDSQPAVSNHKKRDEYLSSPRKSADACQITIPSLLYSLEKHEIYAYERFAYTALKMGVELLADVNLTTNIRIGFDLSPDTPWALNAGIRAERTSGGGINAFAISTSSLMPPFLLAICFCIAAGFEDAEVLREWQDDPAAFRSIIDELGQVLAEAAQAAISTDIAAAVRRLSERLGLTLWNVHDCASHYDTVTHFITGHEVAHAYVGQLNRTRKLSAEERRAFEIIVDLLAGTWTYLKMVKFTPDTDEYREFRGFDTHSEAVRDNSRLLMEGQLLLLAFLAISGAIANKGPVSLDGGVYHPHSCVRFLIQNTHLLTLILSNQHSHFSESQSRELSDIRTRVMTLFHGSGLIPHEDMLAIADPTKYVDVNVAAALIDEFNVRELQQAKQFLATVRPAPRKT